MPDNSTDVKVGKLIAVLVEKGGDWKNVEVPKSEEKTASQKSSEPKGKDEKSKQAEAKDKEEKPTSDKQQTEQSQYVSTYINNKLFFIYLLSHVIGPAARTLLDQYGIEPTKIQGTGPHGVVMKRF
jgi:pyruvate/2-oxoglutarate dehydrogenase complex dihydrolipoamide acyltransferase (E2) component